MTMSCAIYKTNATIRPFVDSMRKVYGAEAGMMASYVNRANGNTTTINSAFTEVIETVAGNTSVTNGVHTAGSRIITVTDGTQFSDGDRVSDGTNIYYVLEISGNEIHINVPLVSDIADAVQIEQVGNTGSYTFDFSIGTAGQYVIMVENPSINMEPKPIPVEIKDQVLDDVHDKLDDIMDELGVVKSTVKFRAFV